MPHISRIVTELTISDGLTNLNAPQNSKQFRWIYVYLSSRLAHRYVDGGLSNPLVTRDLCLSIIQAHAKYSSHRKSQSCGDRLLHDIVALIYQYAET